MENSCITKWGKWVILDEGIGYKVKVLIVNPHAELSYQRHFKRDEIWTIATGVPTIVIDRRFPFKIYKNESLYIEKGTWHQLKNETDDILKIIEVAYGDEITEEDIERCLI